MDLHCFNGSAQVPIADNDTDSIFAYFRLLIVEIATIDAAALAGTYSQPQFEEIVAIPAVNQFHDVSFCIRVFLCITGKVGRE